MNLLQQTLLELWLGDRDELCVVGDDYQSIYSFTGASPEYLLGVAGAVPACGGDEARGELPLVAAGARAREPARAEPRRRREDAARDAGGRAGAGAEAVRDDETRSCRRRADPRARLPFEEMAVLCRTNARLADFEEALHAAGIPFQGASFLGREARAGC